MADIELKYAPRKCKCFCCGDCVIDGNSCHIDYDYCNKEGKELKENYDS